MWTVIKTENEKDLLLAVKWQNAFPKFLQFKNDKTDAEFLEQLKSSHNFLGVNGRPQSLVNAVEVGPGIRVGHLYCDRHTNPDLAIATIMFAASYLFDNGLTDTIIAMVNTRHKTLRNMMLRSGFYTTGSFMWEGLAKNNTIMESEEFMRTR